MAATLCIHEPKARSCHSTFSHVARKPWKRYAYSILPYFDTGITSRFSGPSWIISVTIQGTAYRAQAFAPTRCIYINKECRKMSQHSSAPMYTLDERFSRQHLMSRCYTCIVTNRHEEKQLTMTNNWHLVSRQVLHCTKLKEDSKYDFPFRYETLLATNDSVNW